MAISSKIITVVDVGSTKILCCIARCFRDKIEILGIGYCACTGVVCGVITEMASVCQSISTAVELAERQAKCRIKSVYISVSGKNLKSYIEQDSLTLGGRIVRQQDISRTIFQKINYSSEVILHKLPITFSIDGLDGIRNPIGMVAEALFVHSAVVSIPKAQANNLILCLSQSHLKVNKIIATPYASGLSVIGACSAADNTIVIDIGGGNCTISYFYKSIFCGTQVISYGGGHITHAISEAFGISYADAERFKTLYGAVIPQVYQADEEVSVDSHGESKWLSNQYNISKTKLNFIILHEVEELLSKIIKKMSMSEFTSNFSKQMILVGSGSLLPGLSDFVAMKLNKRILDVNYGDYFATCSEIKNSPEYATAVGLIRYALNHETK